MTEQPQHDETCYLLHSQTMTDMAKPQSPLLVHNLNISKALRHRHEHDEDHLHDQDYIKTVQSQVSVSMREVVAEWLLAVCTEDKCQPQIFHLTVNILDTVLTKIDIKASQLQLLASACLLVSWKIRNQSPISAVKIVKYTSFNVKLEELLVSSFLPSNPCLKIVWSPKLFEPEENISDLESCLAVVMFLSCIELTIDRQLLLTFAFSSPNNSLRPY